MLVRLNPIFVQAPEIQDLAAGLGAITLLVAGFVALVQWDIKRVIAYSTMSQIGYMFLGAGLTTYPNAMFHLMTHAFFKALLFLGAGIVIHALVDEQDMRKMGGLARALPKTYVAMLIGALALAGMPPLSGFFSKDALLAAALDAGAYGTLLWLAGLAGTFLTGLYAFRLIFIVFGGEPSPYVREHLHRPGHTLPALWMAWTVGALTVLAAVGGWIQFAPFWEPITKFLEPVAAPGIEATGAMELWTSVLAVALGLAGIALAWALYSAHRFELPQFAFARQVLEHKLYFDELYDYAFYRPASWIGSAAITFVEGPLIAGSIRSLTEGTRLVATRLTELQTGLLRTYALALGGGAALLTLVFLAAR
jgi:NADH-quinone oxidoreductase subunit L